MAGAGPTPQVRDVLVPAAGAMLEGALAVPAAARGLVVFAHGSGSSRTSARNLQVAESLRTSGHFGTLLFDLLTPAEDVSYGNRFEIRLLTERLVDAVLWAAGPGGAPGLPVGLFGASTGAAAALRAAALLGPRVSAVVSRGGRPDLAADSLSEVRAPTLLIVGGADTDVLRLNREAYLLLAGERDLRIVSGATHLFEEPGTMDEVVALTADWFERHLGRPSRGRTR